MSTVVLRLAAPLQAWPADGKFKSRPSYRAPTHTAFRGMLAAAMGIGRDDPFPPVLRDLNVVFRIDRPGKLVNDFHTINPVDSSRYKWLSEKDFRKVVTRKKGEEVVATVLKASGATYIDPVITERFYVADSVFTAFVADVSGEIASALNSPQWAIFAGRKACTFDFPFMLGSVEDTPLHAATTFPTVHPIGLGVTGATTSKIEVISFDDPDRAMFYSEYMDGIVAGTRRTFAAKGRYSFFTEVPVMGSWESIMESLQHE